jgi:hypothetical protein
MNGTVWARSPVPLGDEQPARTVDQTMHDQRPLCYKNNHVPQGWRVEQGGNLDLTARLQRRPHAATFHGPAEAPLMRQGFAEQREPLAHGSSMFNRR